MNGITVAMLVAAVVVCMVWFVVALVRHGSSRDSKAGHTDANGAWVPSVGSDGGCAVGDGGASCAGGDGGGAC